MRIAQNHRLARRQHTGVRTGILEPLRGVSASWRPFVRAEELAEVRPNVTTMLHVEDDRAGKNVKLPGPDSYG